MSKFPSAAAKPIWYVKTLRSTEKRKSLYRLYLLNILTQGVIMQFILEALSSVALDIVSFKFTFPHSNWKWYVIFEQRQFIREKLNF